MASLGNDRLARRLRALREAQWPGTRITQKALGDAVGVSFPSVSSWENGKAVPPVHHLEAYATFFATQRSVAGVPFRLLPVEDLTADESVRREMLLRELLDLAGPGEQDVSTSPFDDTLLRFPPDENITVVCSALPPERLSQVPYTKPAAPDYVESYRYADLDALLEVFGHLRAANPFSTVHVRIAEDMNPDDYATHLVLLGGVDWNRITAELLPEIGFTVRQLARESDEVPGGFEVVDGEQRHLFSPVLGLRGQRETLTEDVAHFYRAPNPFNLARTVTMFNGMYQRGTLGVVRALTDKKFRDRNDRYLRTRFAGADAFSIVSRVRVVIGRVITPDWTTPDDRLHEWPVVA